MKLYEVRKIKSSTGKISFSTNATERGLVRMGARIVNRGTSDGDSKRGLEIADLLAQGVSVSDPYCPDIHWSAYCLGEDFKYCSGTFFPTPEQMARYMKRR